MIEHVERIGELGLPIVLYNIPGRCGVAMTPETVVKMYEQIPSVVAVKEATGNLDISSQIAASCDITILSGDDSLTLPICSVGGRGVISVVANVLPRQVREAVGCDRRRRDGAGLHAAPEALRGLQGDVRRDQPDSDQGRPGDGGNDRG